jgi:hypothetical protein
VEVAQQFIPSEKGDTSRTLSQLRYLQKAASVLETQLLTDKDLPLWVKNRITKSAAELGIATSYVLHLRKKEEG